MKHAFTECEVGKIGPHCEIACPYPWYGKKCLSKCNCSEDHCDPADGCIGIHVHMYITDFNEEFLNIQHLQFETQMTYIISVILVITGWTQDSLAGYSTTVYRCKGFNGKIHFRFSFCIESRCLMICFNSYRHRMECQN